MYAETGHFLFHKDEIYGENQADGSGDVIPFQGFSLEENHGEGGKNNQGDDFLYDFQLDEGERASVVLKSDAVGRNLERVLEKGHGP